MVCANNDNACLYVCTYAFHSIQFCRHRLEHYEQACAVDSSTFKCAGRPSNCRTAIIGILGTPLRVSCSCQGPTESHYDCVGWQRLLWSNTCVGKIINCLKGIISTDFIYTYYMNSFDAMSESIRSHPNHSHCFCFISVISGWIGCWCCWCLRTNISNWNYRSSVPTMRALVAESHYDFHTKRSEEISLIMASKPSTNTATVTPAAMQTTTRQSKLPRVCVRNTQAHTHEHLTRLYM